MLKKLSKCIDESFQDDNLQYEYLDDITRDNLYKMILQRYIDPQKTEHFLWDRFSDYSAIQNKDGWHLIGDYIKNRECILFFNQDDDKAMIQLKSGKDLDYLLSETFGFEFYVTDLEASYLICFSHHDVLYGCGDAKEWVIEMK